MTILTNGRRTDKTGQPRDPWVRQWYLPIESVDGGEIYTFVTGSDGGDQAIANLCGAYGRKVRDGLLPIIALLDQAPISTASTAASKSRSCRSSAGTESRRCLPTLVRLRSSVAVVPATPPWMTKFRFEKEKRPMTEHSMIYRGYDINKLEDKYVIHQRDWEVVHVAASEKAAKAWIDEQKKKMFTASTK
jgi:hypothetical protein